MVVKADCTDPFAADFSGGFTEAFCTCKHFHIFRRIQSGEIDVPRQAFHHSSDSVLKDTVQFPVCREEKRRAAAIVYGAPGENGAVRSEKQEQRILFPTAVSICRVYIRCIKKHLPEQMFRRWIRNGNGFFVCPVGGNGGELSLTIDARFFPRYRNTWSHDKINPAYRQRHSGIRVIHHDALAFGQRFVVWRHPISGSTRSSTSHSARIRFIG